MALRLPGTPTRDTRGVRVLALVLRLASSIRVVFDRQVAPFDLTMQQAALLTHSPEKTLAQLATILGTDAPGLTRLADRLESRGLLRRRVHPSDRRAVVLEPTPAGTALVPEIKRRFRMTRVGLTARFSGAELDQFLDLLEKLAESVEGGRTSANRDAFGLPPRIGRQHKGPLQRAPTNRARTSRGRVRAIEADDVDRRS
jgi:DNA-binding MarR family transcriptional regulator